MNGLEKLSLISPKLIRRAIRSDAAAMAMREMARMGSTHRAAYKAYLRAMPAPTNPMWGVLKTLGKGIASGGIIGAAAGAIIPKVAPKRLSRELNLKKPTKKDMAEVAIDTIGELI